MSDDLGTVLPADIFNHPDCFSQLYWRWENEVAKPALEKQGYTDIRFYNIERDSFGPLIRGVAASKDGKQQEFFYG
jgi:hypothetical protein